MNTIHTLSSQGGAAARAANAVADLSEVILPLFTDMMRLMLEQRVQFPCKCFSNNVRNWKGRGKKLKKVPAG